MNHTLIDPRTMGQVLQAGPRPYHRDETVAKDLVYLLHTHAQGLPQLQLAGAEIYELKVGDLTDLHGDARLTPRYVGYLVRELGLQTYRRRDGFIIAYTRVQIDILRKYFGL